MELIMTIAQSSSSFYNDFDYIVDIVMRINAPEDNSQVLPFDLVAEQAVSLTAEIITSNSKANRFNLQYGGNLSLGAYIAKSESKMNEYFLSLGETIQLISTIFNSNSEVIDPELKLNINEMFDFNDDVYLMVLDKDDNFKVYRGMIRNKDNRAARIKVKAVMGEGILAERIVMQDYGTQDVGLTVKQIIDNYCSPLTSDNVDINTGYRAPIEAKNKTALSVIENIRRRYGLLYFVDYTWDFNLYKEEDITDVDEYVIRQGD